MLIVDGAGMDYEYDAGLKHLGFRHSGGANVLWIDTHVDWNTESQLNSMGSTIVCPYD